MLRRMLLLKFLLVSLQLACGAQACAAPQNEIRIGVITDLSGKAAYLGQKVRLGAELAQEELRTSGQKIKIIFGDSAFNTTRAVSEAQKMFVLDKVDALFTNFTPIARAVAPIAANAKKILIYTAAAVSPVKASEAIFKSYLDYTQGCEVITRRWKAQGLTKVAALLAQSEYGELCLAGAKKSYPDIYSLSYMQGDPVKTEVLALKAQKVEAVLNPTYEGDLINMIRSLDEVRFAPQLGAEDTALTDQVTQQYLANKQGVLSFGMPALTPTFINKIRSGASSADLTGYDHAGMAYLHIQQLFSAISACPRDDLSCQVRELQSSPANPDFGFLRWSDARIAEYRWSLHEWNRGRLHEITSLD